MTYHLALPNNMSYRTSTIFSIRLLSSIRQEVTTLNSPLCAVQCLTVIGGAPGATANSLGCCRVF